MFPIRDDKFLLIALAVVSGIAAVLVLIQVAWKTGYASGLHAASTGDSERIREEKFIAGKITNISGTTITIETLTPEKSVREITIATDTHTIFNRVVPKDPKVFQNEVDAITKLRKAASTSLSSQILDVKDIPLPFDYAPIKITDLYVGQTIGVEVKEEVTSTNQFTAVKVTLLHAPQQ